MGHFWADRPRRRPGSHRVPPDIVDGHLALIPWLFGLEGAVLVPRRRQQGRCVRHRAARGQLRRDPRRAAGRDWVDLVEAPLGQPRPQRRTKRARFAEARRAPSRWSWHPTRCVTRRSRASSCCSCWSRRCRARCSASPSRTRSRSTPRPWRFTGRPSSSASASSCSASCCGRSTSTRRRPSRSSSMTFGRALAIGLAQALALIPGVSRSGSTMTAGRALGLSREATARYSFMAALPIIGGAARLRPARRPTARAALAGLGARVPRRGDLVGPAHALDARLRAQPLVRDLHVVPHRRRSAADRRVLFARLAPTLRGVLLYWPRGIRVTASQPES